MESGKGPLYFDPNLQIVFSITLIAVLGVASLTPAFPKMAKELNLSASSIGLLITIFTFPGIILTPIFGIWADRWGRKKILIPSLFLFGIAGGACFFVRDFNLLLILRFIQGVGAASLGSINVTIIGDLFSGKDRAAAMGYNASVLSIGTAIYPALGGGLAMIAWYYPFALFFIAIPVGLLALFNLKNPEPDSRQKLGEYLSAAWDSVKDRRVLGLFIASIVTFVILYGSYLTFFPFILGHKFNASAGTIGLIMSAMSISTAITSSQLGKLTKRIAENDLMKIAFIFYAISLISIPFAPSIKLMIIPAVFFGFAQGMNIPSIQTLLAGIAPMEQRAVFMSINGMVLRLGQTLGPLIMAAVYSIGGINWTFFAGAFFAILMVIIVFVFIKPKNASNP